MFPPKLIQISYNRKTVHLTNLHNITGIPFESMVFFDNEYGNIRDVKNWVSNVSIHQMECQEIIGIKLWKCLIELYLIHFHLCNVNTFTIVQPVNIVYDITLSTDFC